MYLKRGDLEIVSFKCSDGMNVLKQIKEEVDCGLGVPIASRWKKEEINIMYKPGDSSYNEFNQKNELDISFTYHPPKPEQLEKYDRIRQFAREFASYIAQEVPNSREQSLAFTALEEAVMWANAGIARRS